MPTENERKDVQKAMAYDLIRIFEKDPEKTYTAEELKRLKIGRASWRERV